MSRLVQIMHTLRESKKDEIRLRQKEIEWQTQVLAGMIANAVENDDLRKQLVKEAAKITIFQENSPVDTSGEDTRTEQEIRERGDIDRALARNSRRQGPGLPFV